MAIFTPSEVPNVKEQRKMEDVSQTLGGVDLSGDLNPSLPEDPTGWTPNDGAAPEPEPTPEPAVDPEPAPEAAPAPADESAEVPTPAEAPKAKGGAFRPYAVLERVVYDDDSVAFLPVKDPTDNAKDLVMESRNAQVALRDAFKAMCRADATRQTATLVVVPQRMWTPTTVAIQTRQTVSVTAG
jgi:hypothetical protein